MLGQFTLPVCSSLSLQKFFAERGTDLALNEFNSFRSAAGRWLSEFAVPYLRRCLLNYVGHIFSGKCFQCGVCSEEVYVRRTRKQWTE